MNLQRISMSVSRMASSTLAFVLAVIGVLAWLVTGPYFSFSDTWLITVTAITDVLIFIIVFSIQNTQYRDSKAIQLKLNELISADKKARDTFIGLETLTDAELATLDEEFKNLLTRLDAPPAMQKLHGTIKDEKAKRPNLYEQTEHLVESIISPLSPKDPHKK